MFIILIALIIVLRLNGENYKSIFKQTIGYGLVTILSWFSINHTITSGYQLSYHLISINLLIIIISFIAWLLMVIKLVRQIKASNKIILISILGIGGSIFSGMIVGMIAISLLNYPLTENYYYGGAEQVSFERTQKSDGFDWQGGLEFRFEDSSGDNVGYYYDASLWVDLVYNDVFFPANNQICFTNYTCFELTADQFREIEKVDEDKYKNYSVGIPATYKLDDFAKLDEQCWDDIYVEDGDTYVCTKTENDKQLHVNIGDTTVAKINVVTNQNQSNMTILDDAHNQIVSYEISNTGEIVDSTSYQFPMDAKINYEGRVIDGEYLVSSTAYDNVSLYTFDKYGSLLAKSSQPVTTCKATESPHTTVSFGQERIVVDITDCNDSRITIELNNDLELISS